MVKTNTVEWSTPYLVQIQMEETDIVQYSGAAGTVTDGRDRHCTVEWSTWYRYR
jgi:hypothetical protein